MTPPEGLNEETAEFLGRVPARSWRLVVYVLAAVLLGGILWSYLSWVDLVVAGGGRLIADLEGREVDAPFPGRIESVHVREGDRVSEGALLLTLRAQQVVRQLSELRDAEASLGSAEADLRELFPRRQELRRRQLDALSAQADALRRNETLLRETLAATQRAAAAKTEELELETEQLGLQVAANQGRIAYAKEKLARAEASLEKKRPLRERELIPEADWEGLVDEVDTRRVALRRLQDERLELLKRREGSKVRQRGSVASHELERKRLMQALTANASDLTSMQGQVAGLELSGVNDRQDSEARVEAAKRGLELAKGRVASFGSGAVRLVGEVAEVRAPVAGTITSLISELPGKEVARGALLVRLAPLNRPLVARISIAHDKIPHVRLGQPVRLKFPAFPYQRHGIKHGTVRRVSADVKVDEGSPSVSAPPAYRVEVALDPDDRSFVVDGAEQQLRLGLQVQAEILTRKRRLIAILFSPVEDWFGDQTIAITR
jgi:multidrug efflux pump subunit AcrA (membrane-fusion protein)